MLVLTRQKEQKIIVEIGGQRMTITVADVRGDKIRLGFDAPASFKIYRQEIYDAVLEENRASTRMRPDDLSPPKA
jgi:carbon storage regulator